MLKERKPVCCKYGVPAPTEEGIEDCGEPVVAIWEWEDSYEPLPVCKLHDEILQQEAENEEESQQ